MCKYFIIGKKSIEAKVEEDFYNDLVLFMTLLNKLHYVSNQNEDSRFLANQSKLNGENIFLFWCMFFFIR